MAVSHSADMASSLSAECTPLKHSYDKCFNSWFEGYLKPGIQSTISQENDDRRAYSKRKAAEFEEKCGKVWEMYRECVTVSCLFCLFALHILDAILSTLSALQMLILTSRSHLKKAVKAKGLDPLLDQARQENPLKEPPTVPSSSS